MRVSDLLCNGGGVTVSWFEMVHHKMQNRMAAYLVAIQRVAEAMTLRGWF
ncbi:hypothetical protein [Pelodictyon phaeoclathratiforme]|nr:hypothetical protein [Pelodictyon phaeoclathratiforme]MBV5290550.1 hypothetical protein [Pelodictyon phaeoclathratiforme]